MNDLSKNITIKKIEERKSDYWVDMSLKEIRNGAVYFYRVSDPITGKWLFKICLDKEYHRKTIKAIKCPAGEGYVQLEGRTMLFQKSVIEGYLYDVISLSYLDDNKRLRRNIVSDISEVPQNIREKFKIEIYEKATGKHAIGKRLVTLCKEDNNRMIIILFLLQRAWPISKLPLDIYKRISSIIKLIKKLEKAKLDNVYSLAEKLYGLQKDDMDLILEKLEAENRIIRLENSIKTNL
jgi:hypothetical protein